MCRLETEGTKHGCGHYVMSREIRKIDCNSQYCTLSIRHPRRCPHCPTCDQYYGPDAKETIIQYTDQYCTACEYWYRGAGSRPHPPVGTR